MNYFTLLFYYIVGLCDAVINLLCALVHYYPSLEMAQEYLLAKETTRVENEINDRQQIRRASIEKADALMQEAKELGAREEV
jgi:hypothetical protein